MGSLEGLVSELIVSPEVALVAGIPRVSSMRVAEHFGKRHDHVIRDIRALIQDCPPEFGLPNFGESSYVNEQNKKQSMYLLTRDGFSLLAMGFTGKKALEWKIRYIEAFNAMEAELRKRGQPVNALTYYTAGQFGVRFDREPLPRKVLVTDVLRLFGQGMSKAAIGRQLGVSRYVVAGVVRRYGVYLDNHLQLLGIVSTVNQGRLPS